MSKSKSLYQLITDDPALARATDRLTRRASVAISSDRRFFEANPDRAHRVRPSHPAELELQSIIAERTIVRPPGMSFYTVTKQLCAGRRVRLFVANTPGLPTVDLTEDEAEAIYNEYATPADWEFEDAIRAKVCGGAS